MTRIQSTTTIIHLCCALLLTVSIASAQFVLPATSPGEKGPRLAFTADVKTTVSSNTPHGSFTQTQGGKYWRSQDGRVRQDTNFGSVITDAKSRTIIHLNHATKEATVITMPFPGTSSPSEQPPIPVASGNASPVLQDLGEKSLAGYVVHGTRTTTRGDQVLQFGDVTTEAWTSSTLEIPLYLKQTSSRGQSVQEFSNIVVGEPNPTLFAIPSDYKRNERTGAPGPQSYGERPPTLK